MTGIFKAESGTNPILAREIAASNPANPFYTSQYIDFRRSQGFTPLILTNDDNAGSRIRCPAFMKTGRVRRSLEIPSVPVLPADDSFWQGLMNFCHQNGISDLSVNSFCSQRGPIPPLGDEKGRKIRWEYVLNLKQADALTKMSEQHARKIKRARKAGVEMQRGRGQEATEAHARLIGASMQRRKERGENVTTSVIVEDLYHLVESGAAEIFQAMLAGQVVSSNIIMLAEKAGYNHSQGTSPEGMSCGAAHFLVYEIAAALRDEGKEVFNLAGTDPDPESGLVRFKTGFGAATEKIELEAVRFMPGNVASCLLRRLFTSGKE